MKITVQEFKLIEDLPPKPRVNVSLSSFQVLNAILYVAKQDCKWRGLPKKFGNLHTIYTRANQWAKKGVLDRVFCALQANDTINIQVDHVSLAHLANRQGNSASMAPASCGETAGSFSNSSRR